MQLISHTFENKPQSQNEHSEALLLEIDFPIESLPDTLKNCVKDCCRVLGVDWDLPAMIGLSCVSAAIGKNLQLDTGDRTTRGNLFCLASAPSGAGKSSCFRPFSKPLQDIEARNYDEHAKKLPKLLARKEYVESECKKLKAKADKLEALAKLKAELLQLEALCKPPQLIAEDITTQALSDLMADNNETLAMLSPDGSDVVSNLMGRWNSTNRTDEGLLLKAWTGDLCRVNRKSSRPVSLKEPCLTLLLCCTPDEVSNLFRSERFVSGGLMPRFLVCESASKPKRRNGQSVSLEPEIWEQWEMRIDEIYGDYYTSEGVLTIEASKGAIEVFNNAHNDYCKSFEDRPLGDSFEARRVEQAKRISVCLHAAQHGNQSHTIPLSDTTAKTAIELATYFGQTAARHQAMARLQKDQETIGRILEAASQYNNGSEIRLNDILQRNNIKKEVVRILAKRFPDRFEIENRKGRSGPAAEILIIKNQ